jgi:hypothetical protein
LLRFELAGRRPHQNLPVRHTARERQTLGGAASSGSFCTIQIPACVRVTDSSAGFLERFPQRFIARSGRLVFEETVSASRGLYLTSLTCSGFDESITIGGRKFTTGS